MEPALQRRVQRYGWDKASVYYETFWQKQLQPAQNKLMQLANIQAGEKVIDIACGTGLVTFRAAQKVGGNGFVLGTDISDKMVELATEVCTERKIGNVKIQRMDAEELSVENEIYDVALCALGFMYIPDSLQSLKEMARVLKPGGRAVAAIWGRRDRCGWADIFDIVDKRVSSEVCPMFFNLGNADMLQRYFTSAGFRDVTSERINSVLEYSSDVEACGAAFAGGPVALAYHKFSNKVKQEAHGEYIESIKAYKQGSGYAIPGEFVVVKGYK